MSVSSRVQFDGLFRFVQPVRLNCNRNGNNVLVVDGGDIDGGVGGLTIGGGGNCSGPVDADGSVGGSTFGVSKVT